MAQEAVSDRDDGDTHSAFPRVLRVYQRRHDRPVVQNARQVRFVGRKLRLGGVAELRGNFQEHDFALQRYSQSDKKFASAVCPEQLYFAAARHSVFLRLIEKYARREGIQSGVLSAVDNKRRRFNDAFRVRVRFHERHNKPHSESVASRKHYPRRGVADESEYGNENGAFVLFHRRYRRQYTAAFGRDRANPRRTERSRAA